MTYLSQFHRQSVERCLKKVPQSKSMQLNCEEESLFQVGWRMKYMTPQQRHKNMAAIHSKDTKPEMIVRKGLWKSGFRYRLNHKRLPGHPDLVLRKYRTCIFVNGGLLARSFGGCAAK